MCLCVFCNFTPFGCWFFLGFFPFFIPFRAIFYMKVVGMAQKSRWKTLNDCIHVRLFCVCVCIFMWILLLAKSFHNVHLFFPIASSVDENAVLLFWLYVFMMYQEWWYYSRLNALNGFKTCNAQRKPLTRVPWLKLHKNPTHKYTLLVLCVRVPAC